MKSNNANRSAPYRSFAFGKIDAPAKDVKNSPKSTVIKGKCDLRCKGGKR